MQRKLKSVFRRSSKSRGSPEPESTQRAEPSSPRGDRRRASADHHGRTSVDHRGRTSTDHHGRTSIDQHGRTSVESSVAGLAHNGRSRPVSSVYDDRRDRRHSQASARNMTATDFATSSDPNGGAIANDYKAYLPALSPVNDDHGDEYMSVGGDRRFITGKNEARHGDVVDRNVARNGTSNDGESRDPISVAPVGVITSVPASNFTSSQQHTRKQSTGSKSIEKYAVGNGTGTNAGLMDRSRRHRETSPHEMDSLKKPTSRPKTSQPVENGWEREKTRISDGDKNASRSPRETHAVQGVESGIRHATIDGTANGEETALARKLREDGVADLRNTADTDGDITWAPAITHEVVKPHKHEIVQHKIYREIHNYEHFHRIQPVRMTEVLPPRHWIPNPNGEGLIEVSADELPARTGENRWWSICEHSSPYAMSKSTPKYRTEPEIIEAGTFITDEGFERKETIIIHPPTLADLSGYGGPVQAVHFDHKTGERWLGELTTMDKLHQLQESLNRAPDARAFEMGGLAESLPKTSPTSMPSRKPVSGHSSTVHGSSFGRKSSVP